MKTLEKTQSEIKNKILEAAHARFGQYGMGKTTMAEIAGDCDMSVGNLYRYYENKTEIGIDCCKGCFEEKKTLLREVLSRPELTAGQRLEAFVMETLNYLSGQFSQQPRLFELVIFISTEHMELVGQHLKEVQALLSEILSEGNKTGEFDVPDVLNASEMILAATMKFTAPHFLSMFPLEQLKKEAEGVVQLLIKGLARH
jgi:AcrR family transcriptional regulator